MPTPHPSSVIDEDIKEFNENFYNKLIEMEKFCYDEGTTGDQQDFEPKFFSLNSAILSYFVGFAEPDLFDYFQSVYTYTALNTQYGISPSILDQIQSDQVFTIGGFVGATLSRDNDYYDDLQLVEDPPDSGIFVLTSPRMDSSIDAVNVGNSADVSTMNSLESSIFSATSRQINIMLYTDPEVIERATKPLMYDKIFNDFGYKKKLELFDLTSLDPFA